MATQRDPLKYQLIVPVWSEYQIYTRKPAESNQKINTDLGLSNWLTTRLERRNSSNSSQTWLNGQPNAYQVSANNHQMNRRETYFLSYSVTCLFQIDPWGLDIGTDALFSPPHFYLSPYRPKIYSRPVARLHEGNSHTNSLRDSFVYWRLTLN